MKIVMRKAAEIRPYENNPRLNDAAVDAVAASIREFGFRQPIVVDADGVIIAGHTRWKAAQKLGLEKVPVHVATDLTPAQVKAYRIADNKLAELASWDMELLPLELGNLKQEGVDLSLLGFDEEALAQILEPALREGQTDPDAIPAPPDTATSKRGEVYQLGPHRLMCGDSGVGDDLVHLLAGQPIHLVNTDPPYNVKVEPRSNNAIAAGMCRSSFPSLARLMPNQRLTATVKPKGLTHHQSFGRHRGKTKPHGTTAQMRPKDRPLENDFMTDAAFVKLLAVWFGNIAQVLLPGRAFYIWGGYSNCGNYPPAMEACKLYFSQAIIWVKEHPLLTRKDFLGNHEWCFYGWREGAAHKDFGPNNAVDVWRLGRAERGTVGIGRGVNLAAADGSRIAVLPPQEGLRTVKVPDEVDVYGVAEGTDVWSVRKVTPQNMVHLTEKPVELAARAIRYSSRAGENVLDLFGGSGSTLIAAEQTGRKAFLMEIDAPYCDVIRRRWAEFVHGPACSWKKLTPLAGKAS